MNGINKITDAIEAESRAETDAIMAEAQAKCRDIEAECQAQAKAEYDRVMKAGKLDGELQVRRLAGAADMEAKKNLLTMKQQAVDTVLKASVKRICELPDERYTAFLAKLTAEAAFTGTEEVVFNKRDCKSGVARNVVTKANELLKKQRSLQPKLTVSSEYGEFAGGVIVRQGDIEVNCTVEALVEAGRDKLASDIASVLFAD